MMGRLIVAIFIGVLLGTLVTVVYIKTLSVLIPKMFQKISNSRADSRNNTGIEVSSTRCFDKTYDYLYSSISRVGWVIKHFIGQKPISNDSNSEGSGSNPKGDDKDSEYLGYRSHGNNVSQEKEHVNQKGTLPQKRLFSNGKTSLRAKRSNPRQIHKIALSPFGVNP